MVANLSAAITSKVLISRPSFGADWLHSGYTILLYSHNVIYARRGESEPIAMNHSCISHPYLRRASIEILIAMVTQHCEDLTAYFFKFASLKISWKSRGHGLAWWRERSCDILGRDLISDSMKVFFFCTCFAPNPHDPYTRSWTLKKKKSKRADSIFWKPSTQSHSKIENACLECCTIASRNRKGPIDLSPEFRIM